MFTPGPHSHDFWEHDDTQQPVQLSAPEYFTALNHWIKRSIGNEKLFPITPGADLSGDCDQYRSRTLVNLRAPLRACRTE
jgi:hypothetical protein